MRPVLKSMLRGHLVGIAQATSKGFADLIAKLLCEFGNVIGKVKSVAYGGYGRSRRSRSAS